MTNERRFYRVEKEARKEKDRQLKWKKNPNESGLIDPRGKLEDKSTFSITTLIES